jgi:TolB-like protein
MPRLVLLLLLGSLAGCAPKDPLKLGELSGGIYAKLNPGKRTTLALVGYRSLTENHSEPFSRYLVDELTTKLVTDGRVAIAERGQLDKVISELKLQSSGLVSDASAKQLGQLLGVDCVLVGSYFDQGKEVKLTSKVIATESGQVIAATTVMLQKDKVIARLLPRARRK